MHDVRRWVPAALVPAAVLAVDPWGLAPFGPVKWLAVPTLVLTSLAVVGPGRPVDRRMTLAWAAFLTLVALAAATGLDPVYAWTGTPERHFGALTWALCAIAFTVGHRIDGEARAAVVTSTAMTAAVLGAWAVAERLGWHPMDLVGVGDRPVATLGSSAYLGAAAVLLLPVAATRRRWTGVLAGVALVLSGARAAWVAALALAAAVRRRSVVLAVVAAVVLALVTGLGARAVDTDDRGGARGRLDEWRVAVGVVADHPLLGTGPEGYRIAFGESVDAAYERKHGRNPLPDRAHDALLDVASTVGLVGLAAYLVLLALVGRALVRRFREGDAFAAAVLAYWVQSLFLFPIAELEPVVWLFAGLAVARGPVRQRRRATTPVAAAALAVVAFLAGTLDVVADHRAKAALDTAYATASEATGATRLRPDQVRYRLAAARALESRGSSLALDQAITQLDHALDVSPRDPVAGLERARLLVARAVRSGTHRADARRAIDELRRHDPRNPELRRLEKVLDGT